MKRYRITVASLGYVTVHLEMQGRDKRKVFNTWKHHAYLAWCNANDMGDDDDSFALPSITISRVELNGWLSTPLITTEDTNLAVGCI